MSDLFANGELKYIRRFGQGVRKRLANDKDYHCAIEGYPGEGKSTFAIKLAKIIDPQFDIEKNVVFGEYDPLVEMLMGDDVRKGTAVVVEEAENIFYKRAHSTNKRINIKYILDRCRFLNIALILILPNAMDLDSFLRNARLLNIFRVHSRKVRRINTRGFVMPWKRLSWEGQFYQNKKFKADDIRHYFFTLSWEDRFNDLPPEYKEIHLKAKTASWKKLRDKDNGNGTALGRPYQLLGAMIDYVNRELNVPYPMICKGLDKRNITVSKSWLSQVKKKWIEINE